MAEKKLTLEELDQVGLACIEIDWENNQKLTTLFHYYSEQNKPLPAWGVNNNGDALPNLSLLARLGKIKQGKQVFKTRYARDMLDETIRICNIEDLSKLNEKDETQVVRKHLQSSVDEARFNASVTDKKLKEALVKADALADENRRLSNENVELKAKLAVANNKTENAEKKLIKGSHQERSFLKRVF
ncbi:MAG: hypothetical protein V7733_05100 [Paraglaciecola polaris]|uniref:hypothetical protein n=1 Tax=Paraglaciecola polaris TaxID=222814 RepID=UPI0030012C02|tara:strand:+ start:5803 stop:6363 length:561 start_codon:yes stop_codon:yes gene_type:complete